MNWEAIGAIGEIVGAVAVVLTVGYLAVQIRQNTRSVRAATHHSSMRGASEIQNMFAQSEDLAHPPRAVFDISLPARTSPRPNDSSPGRAVWCPATC